MVTADDDKLLGENIDTTNKTTVAILVASRQYGPEVRAEKIKQY